MEVAKVAMMVQVGPLVGPAVAWVLQALEAMAGAEVALAAVAMVTAVAAHAFATDAADLVVVAVAMVEVEGAVMLGSSYCPNLKRTRMALS